MKFNLSDLWQAVLSSLIRFWDNRFQQKENSLIYTLKIELERERARSDKLIELITELSSPHSIAVEQQEGETNFKPIGRISSRQRKAELEANARARRQELEREWSLAKQNKPASVEALKSIENLERELGVTE